ncbi:hypothetical protein EMIT0P171_50250 [Pseudomonas sp. IT-P171]
MSNVPPWTLPEKLAMSGVINTVIDSWAFPGSIAFSRFKAGFGGMHLCGCLVGFFKPQLSGRRAGGRRHAGSICFHILHRLSAGSRGVTLQKAHPKGNSYAESGFLLCSIRPFPRLAREQCHSRSPTPCMPSVLFRIWQ